MVRDTTTVLFDIGNVIASDYWEAMWLTPEKGICDRLNLDVRSVAEVGRQLWAKYAVQPSDEQAYWHDFSIALGQELPPELIAEAEVATVRPNPYAAEAVECCRSRGLTVGLMSNNTSFWYPKQLRKARLDLNVFDEGILFVSCLYGVQKGQGPSDLFSRATQVLSPALTCIIDDRLENLRSASTLGFKCIDYSRGSRADLDAGGYYRVPDFTPIDFDELCF